MDYGDLVTHEDYNEFLNLNTTQGDYNTHVLETLFKEKDLEKTYHIPYLDEQLILQAQEIANIKDNIGTNDSLVSELRTGLNDLDSAVASILLGTTVVPEATYATALKPAFNAPKDSYYGKDEFGSIGFFKFPAYVSTMIASEATAEVDSIYIEPLPDSVTEPMLVPEVRAKLNKTSISEYPELGSLPVINGVEIIGELSLNDLGVQSVGNYVTEESMPEQLNNYYNKEETDAVITEAITQALTTYVDNATFTDYTGKAVQMFAQKSSVPQIQIGTSFIGEPKPGDILITLPTKEATTT
jgi:hypothetical protein